MGGVFFRRRFRAKAEVINDLHRDVANFFRIVRRHPAALTDELRYHLTCRDEFQRLRDTNPDGLTDVERAARFFVLQRCAYGGQVTSRTFGVFQDGRPGSFNSQVASRYVAAIHRRLAEVVIEALPYQELIHRYDSPDTLFYLDPPYWGSENSYGVGLFERNDFAQLAKQLSGIAGRFVLSLNNVREVRDLFAAFTQQPVSTRYTVGWAEAKRASELIITN